MLAHQLMRVVDRGWHPGPGFIAREAEDNALVSGALPFFADPPADIQGLHADVVGHLTIGRIESDSQSLGITDVLDHGSGDPVVVGILHLLAWD